MHTVDQVIVVSSITTETWADTEINENRYREVVLDAAIGTWL